MKKIILAIETSSNICGVSLFKKAKVSHHGSRFRTIPMFIVGFLIAATLRSLDVFSDRTFEAIGDVRSFLITSAMFGLGAGVRFRALSNLGRQPLIFGFVSWVVILGFSGLGVLLNAQL